MPAMPHRQRASDKDLWSRTLSLVFLGFLCYAFPWSVFAAPLPIPTDDTPALRIQVPTPSARSSCRPWSRA